MSTSKKIMKNRYVIIALIFFMGIACRKNKSNDCSEAVCPDILIAKPVLKFTLSEKITNQDLFFASPPKYQLKDLAVFKKKNTTDTLHVPLFIDSLIAPKYFLVIAFNEVDTFFIQIQNQKIDTLDIITKPVITNCCVTGYIFSSLKLNGKLICNDCSFSTVVDIKK
jgi:hypothetical protein